MRLFVRVSLIICSSLVTQQSLANSYMVTSNADSGVGTLRQAILDLNSSGGANNTIGVSIPGATTITLSSDLPAIKKNVDINSTNTGQIVDGASSYRLFVTYKASLGLSSINMEHGLAIGGDGADGTSFSGGGGGGLGAGGAFSIDLGQTLMLENSTIAHCTATGGNGGNAGAAATLHGGGGGGASWTVGTKNGQVNSGGGDFPGSGTSGGGISEGETGYGGGTGGADAYGNPGGAAGGYCGGGGGGLNAGGSGGNGGSDGSGFGTNYLNGGGGGYGSGGSGGYSLDSNAGSSGGGGGLGGGGGGGSGGSG